MASANSGTGTSAAGGSGKQQPQSQQPQSQQPQLSPVDSKGPKSTAFMLVDDGEPQSIDEAGIADASQRLDPAVDKEPEPQRLDVPLVRQTGQPLGIMADDECRVSQIMAGSAASGKVKFGDRILSVNGQPTPDYAACRKLLQAGVSHNQLTVTVERHEHPGLRTVTLRAQPGQALGFAIDHYMCVGQVEANTPASGLLAVGDLVLAVNRRRCTGTATCLALLQQCDPTQGIRIKLRRSPGVYGRAPLTVEMVRGESNDGLGAHVNAHLMVVAVEHGSPADGKLQHWDKILAINDTVVLDIPSCAAALDAAGTEFRLTVRPASASTLDKLGDVGATATNQPHIDHRIPNKRATRVKWRSGFDYFLAVLPIVKGVKQRVGLALKSDKGHVIVTMVEKGSLVDKVVKMNDRVLDVDGKAVNDKQRAKELILESLRRYRRVSLLVERPITTAARDLTTRSVSMMASEAPSVIQRSEIKEIATAAAAAATAANEQAQTSGGGRKAAILKRSGTHGQDVHGSVEQRAARRTSASGTGGAVAHAGAAHEVPIGRDTPTDKPLRKVPKE